MAAEAMRTRFFKIYLCRYLRDVRNTALSLHLYLELGVSPPPLCVCALHPKLHHMRSDSKRDAMHCVYRIG